MYVVQCGYRPGIYWSWSECKCKLGVIWEPDSVVLRIGLKLSVGFTIALEGRRHRIEALI